MTDNMKLWNEVKRPPTTALKTIKGGRLSGMSNISPQWRWQIMTEQFGMIGVGWKYTVEKIWTSPGANDEHFAFASVLLYVKDGEQWSEPIPGEGGSMLVSKENKGYHNNDEAFKMAVTDALGTAMAKLGVGADIYLGTFDGSKYNEPTEFKKSANIPKEAKKVAGEMTKAAEEVVKLYTKHEFLKNTKLVQEVAKELKMEVKDFIISIGNLGLEEQFTVGDVIKKSTGETG